MGSGKTTFGKIFSERLKLPFSDLDDLIEKKTGYQISRLFEEKGETYFRDIESELFINTNVQGILACGGGTLDLSVNQSFLQKQNSLNIWLNTDFTILYERIIKSQRPLIKLLCKEELHNLFVKRSDIYKKMAHLQIDNFDITNRQFTMDKVIHFSNISHLNSST
jgi:shikimate kinase